MTHQLQLVEFAFSRVKQKPRSSADLNASAWLVEQTLQIQHWAKLNGYKIVLTVVGTTTSTKPAFAKTVEFRQAIKKATQLGCDLVVADVGELLNRTASDQIVECEAIVNAAPVNIWDATRSSIWSSLPANIRLGMVRSAIVRRKSRSSGARGRKAASDAPAVEHRRRGALINSKKASAAARRHADFVKAEISKLAPGAVLSPSRLARALNDAGIPPSRSFEWGHNSAKNLLRRLEELGLI
jgi:hypothetical protein